MAYTTIKKPSLYFNTKLYTGNGSSQNVTGVGFQPDLNWLKSRSDSSDHNIVDAVRGSSKYLKSNADSAEATSATGVSGFLADGFSVGSDQTTNKNSSNFVSWNWKAGGSTSSNTDGSITSTVSVNSTAGFSIVKWSGTDAIATIGHGLGTTPKVVIVKNIGGANAWNVYHSSISNMDTGYIELNTTGAFATNSDRWSQQPSSTVFGVNANANVNSSGNDYIAYCFAEKTGYSKFGKYTAHNNVDGNFCFLGFKPACLIIKAYSGGSSGSRDWIMFDNKRIGFNVDNNALFPNSTAQENTGDYVDFLSNGFKLRSTDGTVNTNGESYIYIAFAAEPLIGDNPATAR